MAANALELPPSLYRAIMKGAEEAGTSPADYLARRILPSRSEETEEREQGLAYYLGSIAATGDIAPHTATLTLKAWNDLRRAAPGLPVPDAAPGDQKQVGLTWDRGEYHLILEIFPNGAAELFYYNRASDAMWEAEYSVGALPPQEALDRLQVFGERE